MIAQDRLETLAQIKQGFRNLGYVGGLLQEDYQFADCSGPGITVNSVDLAAFAQEPTTYRNASFGVTISNGLAGADFIQRYRPLGAPQILEIGNGLISRWGVLGHGTPELLQEITPGQLPELFAEHAHNWSPEVILRLKSSDQVATQLDFVDLDLLPMLEYEVRTKLDRLLRDTVTLATRTFSGKGRFANENYPKLFRLIFRLIAAKVFADRQHQGDWTNDDPRSVVASVEQFYARNSALEPVLDHFDTQQAVWERIKNTFHFQNLSVDSLAYVYENTLVTPETRKIYGIHSTPPAVAEYIVRKLPFEDLAREQRRVFEPFSGHSVFLVAAMQRLRELLPPTMGPDERHNYFVRMLSGIEIDDFAREVAQLSLMLADYPNPDGWRLHREDAFLSDHFDNELKYANVVLCNPPFELFDSDQRARYKDLQSVWKPAEILHRVLLNPPDLLGFVLPKVFMIGNGYSTLRSRIGRAYSSIQLLALPDRVFQHSDTETVLLIASGGSKPSVHLTTGEVYTWERKASYSVRPSYEVHREVENAEETFSESISNPLLPEVWNATSQMPRLRDFCSIHRGIEYNVPFRANQHMLESQERFPGSVQGIRIVKDSVEPYLINRTVFLDVSPDRMRTNAHELPWHEPKLVVNASRLSRGPWKISASLDSVGLTCYRNFHGVWSSNGLPLEVLAAVLNGPVANAFVSTRRATRYIRVQSLNDIPVPPMDELQQENISSLVLQYLRVRGQWEADPIGSSNAHQECVDAFMAIDAEVLKLYGLPITAERKLLDHFRSHSRPGPLKLPEYFPEALEQHVPPHSYISEGLAAADPETTLERIPVMATPPLIGQAVSFINPQPQAKLPSDDLNAIRLLLEELKHIGPEWDGPGTITPEADVVDRTAGWLAEYWRAELSTPDICPTADGGVSISWQWRAIEHTIDVRSDGASIEWCQYNPRTLQTIETELPMDQQGWDTILAGLNQPAV